MCLNFSVSNQFAKMLFVPEVELCSEFKQAAFRREGILCKLVKKLSLFVGKQEVENTNLYRGYDKLS